MKNIFLLLCAVLSTAAYGQDTLVFDGTNNRLRDAWIWSFTPAKDLNFGVYNASTPDFHKVIRAESWQWQEGRNDTIRGLIQLDLNPLKAEDIEVAYLNLSHYSNPRYTQQVGANALDLHLITEPWQEDKVTWTNQPAFEPTPGAAFTKSISDTQHYHGLEVTELIKAYLDEDAPGIMLKLKNEQPFAGLSFASREHPTLRLRPNLQVVIKKPMGYAPLNTPVLQCSYIAASTLLHISVNLSHPRELVVTDLQGKVVWKGDWASPTHEYKLQVPRITKGLYLIQVRGQGGVAAGRLYVE